MIRGIRITFVGSLMDRRRNKSSNQLTVIRTIEFTTYTTRSRWLIRITNLLLNCIAVRVGLNSTRSTGGGIMRSVVSLSVSDCTRCGRLTSLHPVRVTFHPLLIMNRIIPGMSGFTMFRSKKKRTSCSSCSSSVSSSSIDDPPSSSVSSSSSEMYPAARTAAGTGPDRSKGSEEVTTIMSKLVSLPAPKRQICKSYDKLSKVVCNRSTTRASRRDFLL